MSTLSKSNHAEWLDLIEHSLIPLFELSGEYGDPNLFSDPESASRPDLRFLSSLIEKLEEFSQRFDADDAGSDERTAFRIVRMQKLCGALSKSAFARFMAGSPEPEMSGELRAALSQTPALSQCLALWDCLSEDSEEEAAGFAPEEAEETAAAAEAASSAEGTVPVEKIEAEPAAAAEETVPVDEAEEAKPAEAEEPAGAEEPVEEMAEAEKPVEELAEIEEAPASEAAEEEACAEKAPETAQEEEPEGPAEPAIPAWAEESAEPETSTEPETQAKPEIPIESENQETPSVSEAEEPVPDAGRLAEQGYALLMQALTKSREEGMSEAEGVFEKKIVTLQNAASAARSDLAESRERLGEAMSLAESLRAELNELRISEKEARQAQFEAESVGEASIISRINGENELARRTSAFEKETAFLRAAMEQKDAECEARIAAVRSEYEEKLSVRRESERALIAKIDDLNAEINRGSELREELEERIRKVSEDTSELQSIAARDLAMADIKSKKADEMSAEAQALMQEAREIVNKAREAASKADARAAEAEKKAEAALAQCEKEKKARIKAEEKYREGTISSYLAEKISGRSRFEEEDAGNEENRA